MSACRNGYYEGETSRAESSRDKGARSTRQNVYVGKGCDRDEGSGMMEEKQG